MRTLILLSIWLLTNAQAPDYQEYGDYDGGGGSYSEQYQDYADPGQPDNLYADYAEHKAAAEAGGGTPWGKTFAVGAVGWFLGGKVHSSRAVKKAKKQAAKEQQELYLKYYQDVLALQTQNAELIEYVQQISQQQKDSEFEMADVDHDNKVSRLEFNRYKNAYLSKHPDMASQFPDFEDFDPDANGYISKTEYDDYYRQLGL